jgi:hypothetical protein
MQCFGIYYETHKMKNKPYKYDKGEMVCIKKDAKFQQKYLFGYPEDLDKQSVKRSFLYVQQNEIPGEIVHIYDRIVNGKVTFVYLVKFQNELYLRNLPEHILRPQIELTPETDAVFRDIITDI